MANGIPISRMLSGANAFYNQANYHSQTREEIRQEKALEPIYSYQIDKPQNKFIETVKKIFSYIFFPIFLYDYIHKLIGRKAVIMSASPQMLGRSPDYALRSRESVINVWDHIFKFKRLTVEVDGIKIDVMIMGKPSTLGNGRWILKSLGNAEFYERSMESGELREILDQTNSSALFFNYPKVGNSTGTPTKATLAKVYRAMLAFAEDRENGLGATELIGWGHSIGAVVQAQGLLSHELKPHVKYVFVKGRTLSSIPDIAKSFTKSKLVKFLTKFFNWNMGTVESSRKLKAPEIILQSANVTRIQLINDPSLIVHDGVVAPEASLAQAILKDPQFPRQNKYIIGVPEDHNSPIRETTFISNKINELLRPQVAYFAQVPAAAMAAAGA